MPITTICWNHGKIRMIDQTRLPEELVYLEIDQLETLAEAIKSLRVRGAPALGIAGAFGVLLSAQSSPPGDKRAFFAKLADDIEFLRRTRPTAVNLGWALDRLRVVAQAHQAASLERIREELQQEAFKLFEENRQTCRRLGRHGAELVPQEATVITHCNTGALVAADFGTALGVLLTAHAQGKKLHVIVDETRPLLQGARLNMWELQQEGIPCTLICDNMAAFYMQRQHVDFCIVGADRIAANGDTANKIGTYSLAVNAQYHKIPFYVAAPISTIDVALATGDKIPIEERQPEEITGPFGRRMAPAGSRAYNPAFDVTPHELITAIITEAGVLRPPFEINLQRLTSKKQPSTLK
ncbi:MAG: S-methyl-5-thioribose-1-phosphate isomerase [bacterium]